MVKAKLLNFIIYFCFYLYLKTWKSICDEYSVPDLFRFTKMQFIFVCNVEYMKCYCSNGVCLSEVFCLWEYRQELNEPCRRYSWLYGGVRVHLCFTQSTMILFLYMSRAFRKIWVIDLNMPNFFYRVRFSKWSSNYLLLTISQPSRLVNEWFWCLYLCF